MILPNVPKAERLRVLSVFCSKLSMNDARILESYCHAHRCTNASFHGIPCFAYGDLLLFETDKAEDHIHAAYERYADLVERCTNHPSFIESRSEIKSWSSIWYETPTQTPYHEFKTAFHKTLADVKKLMAEKSKSSVGLFSCPRCKSIDVDTEQKQTRSADEPMTIFCQCTQCSLRFVR